ncbi:hypothetical protein LBMAG53_17240 [Planctomycetota bacterium]|nr:hypothetical protein LBMAG53_17240 [Planctomycetota bacterium]
MNARCFTALIDETPSPTRRPNSRTLQPRFRKRSSMESPTGSAGDCAIQMANLGGRQQTAMEETEKVLGN